MNIGYKLSELGEIPEDWKVVKQEDVATFYNGRAYKLSEWETKGVPVIRLQNLTGSGSEYYYSTLKLPDAQYCKKGDLLYMWSASFGPVWWKGDNAIYHYHIWKIETNASKLDKRFHYYLLNDVTVRMKSQSHGSTMLHVTKSGMEKLRIALPPIHEQRKIAEILSTVDEKIDVIDAQIVKTEELKNGLMQRLFSKGIGHTKFKKSILGQIPDSWDVVKQGEVATFYNGRAYKLSEWESEGVPVIRLQNLTQSGRDYYYSNLQLPNHQYCQNGDLLYMWSATFGPVWWRGDKAIYHYHIWKVEEQPNRLNKVFHYYLLREVTTRMKNQSHGSTMLHVTKSGMEDLNIILPSLDEQVKIGSILSSVDDKLSLLQDKKSKLSYFKKGLMQQLLTGKMRVNHLIKEELPA
jgi:type I restriction enzyme, S subunit